MDIDDSHYSDLHIEMFNATQAWRRRERELLEGPWPVRVCVWCQVGVLPEPIDVRHTSMTRPMMVSTCECGASYDARFIRLSSVLEWGWVLNRYGCTVDGTAEDFTITVDHTVWDAAGG